MFANVESVEEVGRGLKVVIAETGAPATWPCSYATKIDDKLVKLTGWLARAHAAHLRENGVPVDP